MKNNFKIVSLTITQHPIKLLKLGACFILSIFSLFFIGFLSEHLTPNVEFIGMTFQSYIYLIWVAPFVFCLIHIYRFYIRSERKRKNKVANLLRYFLNTNKLYTTDTMEKYKNGKVYNEKYISNSAVLGCMETESEIIIRAFKEGDNFTDKMSNLDTGLSALLQLPLDNKVETVSYCDYIFKIHKDNRLVVADDELVFNDSVILPLSDNLNWNILKQPHLLLAGVTGGGKTTFLNYLIIEMKKMQADVYICDPKRSDLASLKSIIGADFVASEVNNIARLTRIVKEVMEKRFIDYKENADNFVYGHSFVDYGLKPIFIIFDELGAFRASADKKILAETMANLTEVILKGREMGVFAILSTQQPNANNIPTELRDNLSVRLALGNMSSEAYRMVFGEDIKDLQAVTTVGSGYIYLDGLGWSKPKPFEAPYLDYKKFNFVEALKKYEEHLKLDK